MSHLQACQRPQVLRVRHLAPPPPGTRLPTSTLDLVVARCTTDTGKD
jgi:hypothetical protein